MVQGERDFHGSYGMPPHEYDEMFWMVAQDKIDPGQIVSEIISLEEVPDAVAAFSDYDNVGFSVCNEF